MKKIGKIGKINQKERKEIARICRENDWTYCQIQLDGCMGEAHAPAHRHKKRWYRGKPDKVRWDVKQWLPAFQSCHDLIEYNAELTEKIFLKKRGQE